MESFQSSIFDEESKRGEKEKYNPFHSLKFSLLIIMTTNIKSKYIVSSIICDDTLVVTKL